jgi:hypothetical protein
VSSTLTFTFKGKCEGGDGPDLSRYPNLVYSPDGGVRTHIAGASVEKLADEALATGLIADLDMLSSDRGVTFAELLDALDYARANDLI